MRESQRPRHDPLDYVRQYYGVPAKKGGRVTYRGAPGKIMGASGPHVDVKLDSGRRFPVHPTDGDLIYADATP